MGRARESALTRTHDKRSLDAVVSEESLIPIREHILAMQIDGVPYERVLWEKRAHRALRGGRDAHRSIDRLLYGWRERDSDVEQRIAQALGVTLDVARRAVSLMQATQEKDAHSAARGAAHMLVWYTRTQKPIERSVRDGIEQAWRECERDVTVRPMEGEASDLELS